MLYDSINIIIESIGIELNRLETSEVEITINSSLYKLLVIQ